MEQAFVDTLGLSADGGPQGTRVSRSIASSWFVFFDDVAARLHVPGWLGRPMSVGVAWLLLAVGLTVLVAGALGNLAGALALLGLAAHPLLRGIGSLMTPWLPAAVFVVLGLSFLQGLVLPSVALRRASPGRWGPRLLAVIGCGLSLGLASSAEERIGWVMLVPGFLLLLSLGAVGLTLFRVRNVTPASGFIVNPWAILRRTLPWAACWFVVLVLFVQLHSVLPAANTERLELLVRAVPSTERVLAWLTLPGVLVLGFREGQRLGFRSGLDATTVLFVCLVTLWLRGPALEPACGPLERLLAVPAFAGSLACWLRLRG